jgi:hypothetical protein
MPSSFTPLHPSQIPGMTPVMPGQGGTAFTRGPAGELIPVGPPKGTPLIYPWWDREMPGSSDWELNAINFSAVGASTTTVPGFSFTVSSGNRGVLAFLQATVNNILITSQVQFRLLINGGPVIGWSSIYIPPLNATAFVQPFNGMVVRMEENQTLTAQVIVGDATTYTCSLQARGWTTPKNVIESFMSGIPY